MTDDTRIEPPPAKEEKRHTPTPWKVYPSKQFDEASLTAGPLEIGLLYCSDGADEETKLPGIANAAHIVHCVNLHDELVAALTQLREWYRSEYQANPRIDERVDAVLLKARVK